MDSLAEHGEGDVRANCRSIRRNLEEEKPRQTSKTVVSESESPVIPIPTPPPVRPRTNRDWWPNQLNLQVLRQNSPKSNPMGEGFNYAEEFKRLDLEALK